LSRHGHPWGEVSGRKAKRRRKTRGPQRLLGGENRHQPNVVIHLRANRGEEGEWPRTILAKRKKRRERESRREDLKKSWGKKGKRRLIVSAACEKARLRKRSPRALYNRRHDKKSGGGDGGGKKWQRFSYKQEWGKNENRFLAFNANPTQLNSGFLTSDGKAPRWGIPTKGEEKEKKDALSSCAIAKNPQGTKVGGWFVRASAQAEGEAKKG